MEYILALGLIAYVIVGLVTVATTTSELLDEEDFVVRHLVILVIFIPFTLLSIVVILVAYAAMRIGDLFRDGKIHKFLDKPIIKR